MSTAAPQYGHGLVGVAIVGFPCPFGPKGNPRGEVKATDDPS